MPRREKWGGKEGKGRMTWSKEHEREEDNFGEEKMISV